MLRGWSLSWSFNGICGRRQGCFLCRAGLKIAVPLGHCRLLPFVDSGVFPLSNRRQFPFGQGGKLQLFDLRRLPEFCGDLFNLAQLCQQGLLVNAAQTLQGTAILE